MKKRGVCVHSLLLIAGVYGLAGKGPEVVQGLALRGGQEMEGGSGGNLLFEFGIRDGEKRELGFRRLDAGCGMASGMDDDEYYSSGSSQGHASACFQIVLNLDAFTNSSVMVLPGMDAVRNGTGSRSRQFKQRYAQARNSLTENRDVAEIQAIMENALSGLQPASIVYDEVVVNGSTIHPPASIVFVVNGGIVYGTIPDMENGGFWLISPCMESSSNQYEDVQNSCHTSSFFEKDTMNQMDDGPDTTVPDPNLLSPEPIYSESPPSGAPPDPTCSNGLLSSDQRYCCASSCKECDITTTCSSDSSIPNECCGETIQTELKRSCGSFPAPCVYFSYQTVTVYYTAPALASTANMLEFINLAVAETNAGYEGSNIPIRLSLKAAYESDLAELDDSYTQLLGFQGTDRAGACYAVLLANNLGGNCGQAFLDCSVYTNPDDCAYAVVQVSCAVGYFSFGHEIGHIQGAEHNIQVYNPPSRFNDNHGFLIEEGPTGYRTVMAYPYLGETRVNVWSNPASKYLDLPDGVVGSSNNVRILTYTRFTVAAFAPGDGLGLPPGSTSAPVKSGPSATLRPSEHPTMKIYYTPTPTEQTKFPTARTDSPTPRTDSPTFPQTNSPTVPLTDSPTHETDSPTRPTKSPSPAPVLPPSPSPTSSQKLPPTPQTKSPNFKPTPRPTVQPTSLSPSPEPTRRPTSRPTIRTTTLSPSPAPTQKPTRTLSPTRKPAEPPTPRPTLATNAPTSKPTIKSTVTDTRAPTPETEKPTKKPTTSSPTRKPLTGSPTKKPSSASPTDMPTRQPSKFPTKRPTSLRPTSFPKFETPTPTTRKPTEKQTKSPTSKPSPLPSAHPTQLPTSKPSRRPSRKPVTTNMPTTPFPTAMPSPSPESPTRSPARTTKTAIPSTHPTHFPTARPSTRRPTRFPSPQPSREPSLMPTRSPRTKRPTSKRPTSFPTSETPAPTMMPTPRPTRKPKTKTPSVQPTVQPTQHPTKKPSRYPTPYPTSQPVSGWTRPPTFMPTNEPTRRYRKFTPSPSAQPTSDEIIPGHKKMNLLR